MRAERRSAQQWLSHLAQVQRAGRAAWHEVRAPDRNVRRWILVWDLPTRLFKWLLVLSVAIAFLASSMHPRGLLFVTHIAAGYAVVLLLLFRLAWGFAGGSEARFSAFIRGPAAVREHAEALLRLQPEETSGHNPLGGWVILLMLATLGLIVVTGLLTEGVTGGAGVLSALLPSNLIGPIGWLHGTLGFAIIWLAGFHVAGVLVESLLLRENLIRAMITGRKRVRSPALTDARPTPSWRALLLLFLLGLLGAWMIAHTRLPAHSPLNDLRVGLAYR
ncbi:MAG: cytochrome b/b6 domain-containing protein [Acetobacteraceae bacterium]